MRVWNLYLIDESGNIITEETMTGKEQECLEKFCEKHNCNKKDTQIIFSHWSDFLAW